MSNVIAFAARVFARTCLKCGKVFRSQGIGNRVCPTCNKQNLSPEAKYWQAVQREDQSTYRWTPGDT